MPGAGTRQGSQGGDVGDAGYEFAGRSRPYVHDPASSLGQTYIGPNSMLSPVGALPPGLQYHQGQGLEALSFLPYEGGKKRKMQVEYSRGQR